MKRYKIIYATITPIEDPDGGWVRYEDALKANDKAFSDGRESAQMESPIECNCVEMADGKRRIYCLDLASDTWWICPAHGYKRL